MIIETPDPAFRRFLTLDPIEKKQDEQDDQDRATDSVEHGILLRSHRNATPVPEPARAPETARRWERALAQFEPDA